MRGVGGRGFTMCAHHGLFISFSFHVLEGKWQLSIISVTSFSISHPQGHTQDSIVSLSSVCNGMVCITYAPKLITSLTVGLKCVFSIAHWSAASEGPGN